MALDVEGVVGCRMHGKKSLRRSDALEPLHLPLPSSGRLMRILRSVVAPSAAFMAFCDSKIAGSSSIRSKIICDELVWDKAIFLQQLAHQFERRPLVPRGLHQHIKNFTLGIHGTPEVDQATIDLDIDFVEMPDGMRLRPAFAQICRDHRPKMIHPAPNGLVGDHDAPFRQQVFDVTEAQCEPEIEPDRLVDDLWRKAVAAIADFLHPLGYRTASGTASPKRRDNAFARYPAISKLIALIRPIRRGDGASYTLGWRERAGVRPERFLRGRPSY